MSLLELIEMEKIRMEEARKARHAAWRREDEEKVAKMLPIVEAVRELEATKPNYREVDDRPHPVVFRYTPSFYDANGVVAVEIMTTSVITVSYNYKEKQYCVQISPDEPSLKTDLQVMAMDWIARELASKIL